jgi:hypothetical protein
VNLLSEKQRCRPLGAAAYFGGSSKSATTETTEIRDMRVVGGTGSANVSANDSNVTVISTDQGAVNAGLQLGGKAIDASIKAGEGLNKTTLSLFDGALAFAKTANATAATAQQNATSQVAGAYANVAKDLATAFTDSKAPDKNIFIIGGVAVVGLAAVMVLGRKG